MEVVTIMLLGAILSGLLASSRGRSAFVWALVGALVPLISLLILVLMPDLKAASLVDGQLVEAEHQRRLAQLRAARPGADDETKTCPRCAETVKRAAQVCRYCGHEFPIDGEAIVLRPHNSCDFEALRSRQGQAEAILVAYDIIEADGQDVRSEPLEERRKRLAKLLSRKTKAMRDGIQVSEAITGDGAAIFRHACWMSRTPASRVLGAEIYGLHLIGSIRMRLGASSMS